MKVAAEITINKNKSAVWSAITDIRNSSEILSGVEKIEILNESANGIVGLKWRETRVYFGNSASIEKWITDAEGNNYFKTRAEMDGFIFITTMTISGNENNIILTSSHETLPQGFIAKMKSLPMLFFKGMLKKAILNDLNDIKKYVENK